MRARWWLHRRPALLGALAALGLYTLLALLYTYPLVTHLDSGVLRGLDTGDALQQTWVLAWVQHVLAHQPTALFDAPIFYPTHGALAYHDNLVPIAVLLLPLRLLTQNPLVIYNLAVLLAYPLCGLGMYALALHLCGDRRAALLAGLIFAFCPYRERHVEHLNLLSAEGIPLLILGFELARTRGGAWRWAGVGAALALGTMLSLYYAAFAVLGVAIYALVVRFRRLPLVAPGAWRGSWALVPLLLLEGGLLAPYLQAQRSVGGERRLQDVVYFSADVRDYLHAGPQSLLYGWSDAFWHIAPLEVRQYLFPGWIALALALLGALAPLRRRAPSRREARSDEQAAWSFLSTAGVLGLFALGPYLRLFGLFTGLPLPYFVVYLFVPGYQGFRDIGRYDQVAMAFVAGAAAIGAARLLRQAGRRPAARLALALLLGLALEYATVQRPLYPVASGARVPPVYRWLATQPPGVTLELPICGLPGAKCLEESDYMYYSTYHWHPLVNGGGGFFPPDWDSRTTILNRFPAPMALGALRSLGVRYVIVHPNYPNLAAVQSLVARGACDCRPTGIAPLGSAAPSELPASGATVGGAQVRRLGSDLVFVFDGRAR